MITQTAAFHWFELFGVFFYGMAGGLAAIQKHYDVFSVVMVGWVTALGGGILRDVVIGQVPPAGISDWRLIVTAIGGGILVCVVHPRFAQMQHTALLLDAIGLACFSVQGAMKGIAFGLPAVTCVLLGMITGIGGGTFRDLLLGDVPQVLRDRHMYVVPAFLGSVLATLSDDLRPPYPLALQLAAAALIVGARLASIHFGWLVPRAELRDWFPDR